VARSCTNSKLLEQKPGANRSLGSRNTADVKRYLYVAGRIQEGNEVWLLKDEADVPAPKVPQLIQFGMGLGNGLTIEADCPAAWSVQKPGHRKKRCFSRSAWPENPDQFSGTNKESGVSQGVNGRLPHVVNLAHLL
jgi:hypothetical protein